MGARQGFDPPPIILPTPSGIYLGEQTIVLVAHPVLTIYVISSRPNTRGLPAEVILFISPPLASLIKWAPTILCWRI